MAAKTTTYWKAACIGDSNAYSLRDRTKKAIVERLERAGFTRGKAETGWGDSETHSRREVYLDAEGHPCFELPEKVEIEYTDQMDLINQLMGEGSSSF